MLLLHRIILHIQKKSFRKKKLIMTIDIKIRSQKLQYYINREAKISALSSGKIDKYEYLTGEETLPSNKNK